MKENGGEGGRGFFVFEKRWTLISDLAACQLDNLKWSYFQNAIRMVFPQFDILIAA